MNEHLQGVAPKSRLGRAGAILAAQPALQLATSGLCGLNRFLWSACRLERAH